MIPASLYDIGITAEYGDELLVLSTCSHHTTDGRFVVVAKGTPSHPLDAPTACKRTVSGSIALPCSGSFSPFPHGTGSLSVSQEYLALEDGPPIFKQDVTCPALLVFING